MVRAAVADKAFMAMRASTAALAVALLLLSTAASAAQAKQPRIPDELIGITPATRLGQLELARMQLGGVTTLRVPFFWEDLQPYPGQGLQFTRSDELVAYGAYYGIRMKPFVMGVPPYFGRRDDHNYPPIGDAVFRREWKQLLRALVDRYGPGGEIWRYLREAAPEIEPHPIRSWQIWNEANAWTYWHPQRTAPTDYAKLLRISANVIRNRDPGATIVTAGFFEHPSDGVPMRRFVRRLYDTRGAARSFDALAIHPYSVNIDGMARQIEAARLSMLKAGDSASDLWVTEIGWPTAERSSDSVFTKTEFGQRRALRQAFNLIIRKRRDWRIGSLIWYTWADTDVFTTCDLCSYSGLFRSDLTAKPAWEEFVGFTGGRAEP